MPQAIIAGVDEAGRGPLAGPVMAAAVILNPEKKIKGLKDSKILTAEKRDELFDLIQERSLAWAIASASVEEIDELNILRASLLAMKRAIEQLSIEPMLALVDGNQLPNLLCASRAIIDGDTLIEEISAASILAKVTRDREMERLDKIYPGYGFKQHKGYGTKQHIAALNQLGPCQIHRRSFAPVANLLVEQA